MSRLEHLRKSIAEMTPDELREHIRHIREDRRLMKLVEKTPRAKREKKAKDVSKLLESMSMEEKLRLLRELSGGE